MAKYKLEIKSDCGNKITILSGESVRECIDKVEINHSFGEVERKFFTEKGEDRLNEELNSGWYTNLENK